MRKAFAEAHGWLVVYAVAALTLALTGRIWGPTLHNAMQPTPAPPMTAADKAFYHNFTICRDEMAIRSAKQDVKEAEARLQDDRADVIGFRLEANLATDDASRTEYGRCMGWAK